LHKLDARFGILKYKGSLNTYLHPGLADDERIDVGDKCIFKQPPVMLEAEYHSTFDGKNQYRISQLFNIAGFFKDDLYASVNHVVIVPDIPTHKGGVEIPLTYRKPSGFGKVYNSGYGELSEGDTVYYMPSSSVTVEHNGETLHICHFNYIFYKV